MKTKFQKQEEAKERRLQDFHRWMKWSKMRIADCVYPPESKVYREYLMGSYDGSENMQSWESFCISKARKAALDANLYVGEISS